MLVSTSVCAASTFVKVALMLALSLRTTVTSSVFCRRTSSSLIFFLFFADAFSESETCKCMVLRVGFSKQYRLRLRIRYVTGQKTTSTPYMAFSVYHLYKKLYKKRHRRHIWRFRCSTCTKNERWWKFEPRRNYTKNDIDAIYGVFKVAPIKKRSAMDVQVDVRNQVNATINERPWARCLSCAK